LTDIYADGDACPVRDEIYRVAARPSAQRFRRLKRLPTDPAAKHLERKNDHGW
jgi:hypothetical protein